MHQPHPTLTPTDYANLYQACINTGWDEASLDLQVVRIETAAATRGYVAAALKGLRHEGPPPPPARNNQSSAASERTQPRTIQTARIAGQPNAGRRILPHPFDGDGQDCAQCQLPPANTTHLRGPTW